MPPPPGSADPVVLGLVLAATGVATAPVALAAVGRLVGRRVVFFARWGFGHVLAAVVCAALGALAAGILVPGEGPLALVLRAEIALGAAALYAAWTAWRTHPEGLRALGLQAGGHGRAVLAGVAGWLLVLPAIAGLEALSPALLSALGIPPSPGDLLGELAALRGAELATAAILVVLVTPLVEEVVFRSFLQPLLVQNLSEAGGVLATSLAFAALHPQQSFLPLLALSLLLGLVKLKSQRLTAVWAVHGLHNGAVLAAAVLLPEARDVLG